MDNTYDYIIIGAGSAGCVLAHRLSADPKNQVLLLEAGGKDKSFQYHMPFGYAFLYVNQKGNWSFRSEKMKGAKDRTIYFPRGKVLGGSSSLNAMLYVRGHSTDYDDWAELGNKGWSYKDVLPYFKKSENHELGASEFHGVGGPLSVSTRTHKSKVSEVFIEAATALGFKETDDFNGAEQDGFAFFQQTIKQGKRHSTATAYLKPVLKRPNLTVLTDALVTKIFIDDAQAKGVELMVNGMKKTILASKETLLCAGAIQSPQILLLSGVGPEGELKNFGIDTILDLPGVGKNLRDHPVNGVVHLANPGISVTGVLKNPFNFVKAIFQYLFLHKGIFANSVGEVGAFIRTQPDLKRPDVQIHFGTGAPPANGEPVVDYTEAYFAGVTVLRPFSLGEVRLKSASPTDAPAIDLNYYEDPRDIETALRGLKIMRNVLNHEKLKPFSKGEQMPGSDAIDDDQLKEYLRATVGTIYHPVGTCKMGHDKMAVVDDRLKVHGIKGLRVVDASIMPTLVGGNTNAPTIMIAEKAADMILEDNR